MPAVQRRTGRRSRPTVAAAAAATDSGGSNSALASEETDIVIIGSGIGGLCAAALLARYGQRVTVCESHYLAGGAAHGFEIDGYAFDAGPSFFAGLSGPPGNGSTNPLKQVGAVCAWGPHAERHRS